MTEDSAEMTGKWLFSVQCVVIIKIRSLTEMAVRTHRFAVWDVAADQPGDLRAAVSGLASIRNFSESATLRQIRGEIISAAREDGRTGLRRGVTVAC